MANVIRLILAAVWEKAQYASPACQRLAQSRLAQVWFVAKLLEKNEQAYLEGLVCSDLYNFIIPAITGFVALG